MGEPLSRPLGAYRIVELPGAAPLSFGKTFADLGADVIKVEPPGGDEARALPPFSARGESLYWAAYSAGTQSVTIDLDSDGGRRLVHDLAACADVLVEAYPPGWLTERGLGYADLHALNPRLVLSSITPFGQTGPYAEWRGSDLVQFAMGGYLNMTGPAGGPPLKPSAPYQTYLHACTQAVAATLLALRSRRRSGRGSHVDQAMRDTGPWMLTHTYQFWDLLGMNLTRQGSSRDMGGALRLPGVWRARDGYVVWMFQTGHIGGARVRMLVDWMAEHGLAPDWLREIDWPSFDLLAAGPEANRRLTAAFAAFFTTRTKQELFDWSLARGVMLAPVQTLPDVADDVQLAARGAWRAGKLGADRVREPGPPVRMSAASWEPRDGVPAAGEHNEQIFGSLLGVSAAERAALHASGAI